MKYFHPAAIVAVEVEPLNAAMNAPFEIATGKKTEVRNVLVRLKLAGGTMGFGEAAPKTAAASHSQEIMLRRLKDQRGFLLGKSVAGWRDLILQLDERLDGLGPAKAAMGMAVLDAWTRLASVPLRRLFGGASAKVHTDVTVTLGTPQEARLAALDIVALGIRTIKIKVGRDVDDDARRILAVAQAGRKLKIFLDANCGYSPAQSLKLLKNLKKRGIVPILFEQPAALKDLRGLAEVHAKSGVPVAADESVANRQEAREIARHGWAQVINIKLMKCGILEAWDIARIGREAGLGLMIGGMVESSLAMTCSAHFAAGFGGFDFVDLDTPFWFKKEPMTGMRIGRGGLYDLSRIKAGIGVRPSWACNREHQ